MPVQPSFLLQLGNTPDLSFAELQAVFGQTHRLERLGSHVASLTEQQNQILDPQQLLSQLGGTVKITRVLMQTQDSSESSVQDFLKKHLLSLSHEHKLHFAIAEWGRDHLPSFDTAELKSYLQSQGRSVRYVKGTRSGLSAAVLIHKHNIQEFVIVSTQDVTLLAQTVAVQNIDHWTAIDRGKPFAQHQRGILPPKLARIMVNLALGESALNPTALSATRLWDPFCGAATVLFEAAQLGVGQVYGSDVDPIATKGAQTNLDWFAHTIAPTFPNYQSQLTVFQADATHIDQPPFPLASISAVVTEPFLGKQTPRPEQIPNVRKGLEKLYLGSFKAWRPWLQNGATLVFITPRWIVSPQAKRASRWYDMRQFIDNLKTIGYTTKSEPFLYGRPQAQVQREIWTLEYRSN